MSEVVLETKRLILRCQKEQDLNFLLALWTDNEVTKYVGGPREKAKLIDSFNEVQINKEDKYDLWYVVLKESAETIGMAGLLQKEIESESHYEVSFFIDRKYWNNGYATEIAEAIVLHHRNSDGIKTFVAIVDKENVSSINVAQKIGMTYWKSVTRIDVEKEIYKVEYE